MKEPATLQHLNVASGQYFAGSKKPGTASSVIRLLATFESVFFRPCDIALKSNRRIENAWYAFNKQSL